jgi:hypothetical protein
MSADGCRLSLSAANAYVLEPICEKIAHFVKMAIVSLAILLNI